ncbi:hypothetical protein FPOA_01047 [Fusarium poae]|uniref:NAD(P)-binding domain-containing protein n=1 Tax=Fusarium poae TaxID=36050 RepID=A0A1B8B329_FUSPO|nr:hypothetical protein FPOA_01047 [Fusarium poae]
MASNRHVLILGGNGKISRLLTVMLLQKSWTVTSLIRNPDQIDDLKKISEGLPGTHKIVVHDLITITSQEKAAAVIDEVNPDSVVFSAGPGRGTDQDTIIRIDRDAAIFFTQASVANETISHHVQVSYLGARREQAPWWTPEDWEGWKKVNSTFLGPYYEPKVAADEALVTEGGVLLGQTKQARGMTTRASTARAMALVLEQEHVKGHWLDVLDGEEDAQTAVDRYAREETECALGEPSTSFLKIHYIGIIFNMGCIPKLRLPRRLRRWFKKKNKDNQARESVELSVISRPFNVYRIDSKGNRQEMPQFLPAPADLYGQVVAPATNGTGLTYLGMPVPDGSAVTDGSGSEDSVAVDTKAKTGAQVKQQNGDTVAGPSAKDI